MYFEKLFSNFETTVMSCLDEFNLIPVHDVKTELAINEYYFQDNKSRCMSVVTINSDPFPIIQKILNLDPIFRQEFEKTSFLMGEFFCCNFAPISNKTNYQLAIGFGTNARKENFIVIKLSEFQLMIHMTKERGTIFENSSSIIPVDNVIDNDDNINICIHNSINRYKQAILNLSCVPYGSNFDDELVKLIKSLTFEELVNNKINSDHFICHRKDAITSILDEEEIKYPKSSFEKVNNSIKFTMKDTSFLLKAIRPMLSSVSYKHFLKATNFFDNYQKLMNRNDGVVMSFHNKHKLKAISGAIFSVCFGDNVYIDVNLPSAEKNKDLFEIYTMKHSHADPENIVQCSDLSKLFDYLFDEYAHNLSNILSKPVDEMDINDATVLMMVNF